MSEQLLTQLEEKIDNAIENIELLRLQIEELEEKNISHESHVQIEKNKVVEYFEEEVEALA